MDIAAQIALGICLAASAGLRAFAPMLIVSILGRLGYMHFAEQFEWVQSNEALIVLAIAALADLVADKVPVVHHVLDIVHTVIRPIAGIMLMAGTQQHLSPAAAMVVGVAVGLPIAGGVHAVRTSTRVAATVTTGGCLSPLLSFLEDIVSTLVTLMAVFSPFLTLALVIVATVFLGSKAYARLRRQKSLHQGPPDG